MKAAVILTMLLLTACGNMVEVAPDEPSAEAPVSDAELAEVDACTDSDKAEREQPHVDMLHRFDHLRGKQIQGGHQRECKKSQDELGHLAPEDPEPHLFPHRQSSRLELTNILSDIRIVPIALRLNK